MKLGVVAVAMAVTMALVLAVGPVPTSHAQEEPPRLSGTQVARLFDRPLPALSQRTSAPAITGDRAADRRIAAVARERGYRFRGDPLDALGWYQGRRLHQRAIDDLIDLQAAMRADIGVQLQLTAAHRSVSYQRAIFRARLAASSMLLRGRVVSSREVAAGRADDVLHRAMRRAAPPGFSKHHTGYAIDVASGGFAGFGFRRSAAWRWLARDRFANAMRFGWIPSYPDRATGQGPDPEPWEWVWIGRDAAACAREATCARGGLDSVSVSADRVRGWAMSPDGTRVRRLRLVTADGSQRLRPDRLERFDVELVHHPAPRRAGFVAPADLRRKLRWACLEARAERRGPWSRVSCVELG